jgi:DNA repair protein RecO (recombination protein O)
LYGLTHLTLLCRLLPERDPHPQIHAALGQILGDLLDVRRAGPCVARFELRLLTELGFGLDLERCAATGSISDLAYVSPRTGRAVSRCAGQPWHDRLLRLPSFLSETEVAEEPRASDLADGFALTEFFLSRHVLEPRGLALAEARASFVSATVAALRRQEGGVPAALDHRSS